MHRPATGQVPKYIFCYPRLSILSYKVYFILPKELLRAVLRMPRMDLESADDGIRRWFHVLWLLFAFLTKSGRIEELLTIVQENE